jgi:hypothetical protein
MKVKIKENGGAHNGGVENGTVEAPGHGMASL